MPPIANTAVEVALSELFQSWSGHPAEQVLPLPPSGSNRSYYRIQGGGATAIGTYNPDVKENEAFVGFSRHFDKKGLPVPEIYATNLLQNVYLQEDLGSTSLYSQLPAKGQPFTEILTGYYQKVVEQLARLQIEGGKGLDYRLCYPSSTFDEQSMRWDFNTFKYYFLRLSGIPFDEQRLEEDLKKLSGFLLQADTRHFMFRDFQSRNILLKEGKPYFIDYQGGRKGALQYDLASLLYQAKANIPEEIRWQLLNHYLDHAGRLTEIQRGPFIAHYYGYVLMRTLQVLGTYGYRGIYERKEHFLKSIPFALKNAKWLLEEKKIQPSLPELQSVLYRLAAHERFQPFDKTQGAQSPLRVKVSSFSYKKGGIPKDETDNGGGFVFDCRFIHNPGRYEPYKKLTGRDEPVQVFLQHRSQMNAFLNDVYRIVGEAVENYVERGFSSLMVSFGCTGGQHRSVYAADALAAFLKEKYAVEVELQHIEQEKKGWVNE
jgi:aminoglycoside/choline kinase family phosphotransferase